MVSRVADQMEKRPPIRPLTGFRGVPRVEQEAAITPERGGQRGRTRCGRPPEQAAQQRGDRRIR